LNVQYAATVKVGTAALTGKTAIVTGAASGIGEACAHALAEQGAHVIAVDIDAPGASRVADDVDGESRVIDLMDVGALAGMSFEADILVNNAGIQSVHAIEEFEPALFRHMVDLMLIAPFLLTRSVLPAMYARGWGRVVNISSVHGLRASQFKAAYVAAKHGLEGLSKVIALEGAAHGVTSVCVNPGYVRTPLVEKQVAEQARLRGIAESEVLEQVLLAGSAIKRLVEPAEVAALVAWLCGPDAGMATGSSYALDGGWTAR
jgi:3-hydroxybutyrate dehydrogenase